MKYYRLKCRIQKIGAVIVYVHNENGSSGTHSNSEERKDGQESEGNKFFNETISFCDCFKILGLDLDTNLNQAKLNRAYCTALRQEHLDKAPHDEVSQQKAIHICEMINHARDILQEMFDSSSVEMSDNNSDDNSDS